MNKKTALVLQSLDAMVWDYDGVHYDYASFPPLEVFDDTRALAARMVLPTLSAEEALRLGVEGYKLYGDVVHNYMLWAERNGYDAMAVRDCMFKTYHRELFNRIVREFPDNITRDPDAVAAFNRCASVVQHGLATHSCVENWAGPYLKRQDLMQFFNEKALIGLDNANYQRKTESVVAIDLSLTAMSVPAKKAGFADDLLENLKCAHENMPGLTTVFIHQGKPLKTLPPFVTLQAHDPKSLMKSIALARGL